MATTYKQAFARANATNFQQRVRMALARVCGDVVGEAIATMGTVIHNKRHDHAHTVLHGLERDEMVKRYALAVVMEPQLVAIDALAGDTGDEVPDATLFTNVRNLFPKFAGVKATDAV